MAIFRLQEHTPDVYPRKSRDFQLLCNVFDCMNNGVKFDIDSIRDITNTDLCNERVLNYLQTKLGFFSNKSINTNAQRLILKAFPYLIKNKGSRKGIEQAIQVFLKTQGVQGHTKVQTFNKEVSIDAKSGINKLSNIYVVELGIQSKLLDTTILDEILKYIIPAGYLVKYSFYKAHNIEDEVVNSDTIKIIFVQESLNSGIRLSESAQEDIPLNAVGLTTIPSNNITEAENFIEGTIDKVKNNEANYTVIGDKEEDV